MNAFNRWIRLAAPALALMFSLPAAAEPPTIEEFLLHPQIRDLALSPSGNRLAVVVVKDESRLLAVYQTADFSKPPQVHPFSELTPLWVEWASDERLLLALADLSWDRRGWRLQVPSARVISLNVDGSDPVVLFADQQRVMRDSYNLANITDVLPNDPNHVIMPGVRGKDLDLWKVNVYSGSAERIGVGTTRTVDWVTDINGSPAARLDANGSGSIISIYAPESFDVDARWRRVARVHERDRPEFDPIAYAEEPGQIYVLARAGDRDRAAVFRYDFRTNTILDLVAENDRFDLGGILRDPMTGEVLGTHFVDHVVEYEWADPLLQQEFDELQERFGAASNVRVVDTSTDRRKWLIFARGPQNPGSHHFVDFDTGAVIDVASNAAHLTPERLGAAEPVVYAARDGTEIVAYVTRPPGVRPPPYPTVVMPHGGPEYRDALDYDRMVQFLTTRGYLVIQPNFRGSSGYGEAFMVAGRKQWGGLMQDDISDALAHFVGQGLADPDKVCIVGASYGGYAALAGAAFTPDLYKCAVSINGVSDLHEFFRQVRRDKFRDDENFDYWKSVIGDPRGDSALLKARSPAEHADQVTAPVLLLHGSSDIIVNIEQSERMERALERAGKRVEFVRLSGAGHGGWGDPVTRKAYEEMETFLAEFLPLN